MNSSDQVFRRVVMLGDSDFSGWEPERHSTRIGELSVFPQLRFSELGDLAEFVSTNVPTPETVDHWVVCITGSQGWNVMVAFSAVLPKGKVTYVTCPHDLMSKLAAIEAVGHKRDAVLKVACAGHEKVLGNLPANYLETGRISLEFKSVNP